MWSNLFGVFVATNSYRFTFYRLALDLEWAASCRFWLPQAVSARFVAECRREFCVLWLGAISSWASDTCKNKTERILTLPFTWADDDWVKLVGNNLAIKFPWREASFFTFLIVARAIVQFRTSLVSLHCSNIAKLTWVVSMSCMSLGCLSIFYFSVFLFTSNKWIVILKVISKQICF